MMDGRLQMVDDGWWINDIEDVFCLAVAVNVTYYT